MRGPGLNMANVKPLDHMRREVFQFDGGIAALVLRARDELAKGIGRNRHALARLRRKLDRGLLARPMEQRRKKASPRRRNRSLRKKFSPVSLPHDATV